MQHQAVLDGYLKQLHLSTFVQNYQVYAQDAARTNLPYERYLLALCGAEVAQRDALRIQRAIAAAKFPVFKDLATFDFEAIPTLPKQRVLDLAQGSYMAGRETVILIGNPGLGKVHLQHVFIATALNFARISAWRSQLPRAQTRQAAFVRLVKKGA